MEIKLTTRRRKADLATATKAKLDIKPLGSRVVVEPSEGDESTASGLYIAQTSKEKPQKGTILAVGPGEWEDGQRSPMDVKEGDTVLFAKYAGTEFKYQGEEYLILSQKDVLAKIKD
jgi:chaperonin GroES